MRFLLDQNLSPATTIFLKSLGLAVTDVRDVGLSGKDDNTIYTYALRHKLVIITFDHEFGYKYISRRDLEGLILLRIHPQTKEIVHLLLKEFFSSLKEPKIKNSLIVVERHKVRIRKINPGSNGK